MTVVTTLVCSLPFAHEAADALSVRRSARPHMRAKDGNGIRRPRALKNRGDHARVEKGSARWEAKRLVILIVMPGLDPGIHLSSEGEMDCRVKPGNDEEG